MSEVGVRELSRRDFFANAGKLAVGAGSVALLSSVGTILVSEAEESQPRTAAPLPWPYKKLDPQAAAEITYNSWYKGFCTYAVANGIISLLQKEVGEPWTTFPLDVMIYGHGGVVGWGTMCGTMLGAGLVANLVCGSGVGKTGEQVTNEVIYWYTTTELPIYTPQTPKAEVKVKSKSNSPLCHISVNKWMKKAKRGFWTPERKDRCARLSADTAAYTVTLLNDWADGKFKSDRPLPPKTLNVTGQRNCAECHPGKTLPEVITIGNP